MEWISVKENLPKCNEKVLIYTGLSGIEEASINSHGEWSVNGYHLGLYKQLQVTHWMPLPEVLLNI